MALLFSHRDVRSAAQKYVCFSRGLTILAMGLFCGQDCMTIATLHSQPLCVAVAKAIFTTVSVTEHSQLIISQITAATLVCRHNRHKY